MGMHWGSQTVRRDDLIGHDVNLASRISDLADAGELMLSQATVEVAREAGASLEFDDMGPTLVKGIPDPVHVFRAVRDF
jgi:class 3 adenylate cyclase